MIGRRSDRTRPAAWSTARRPVVTLVTLALLACAGPSAEPDGGRGADETDRADETHRADLAGRLDAARSGAIADSVRAFADSVAVGVTTRGPAAWRDYLADEPEFFMAVDGRVVFPNSDAAERAIQNLVRLIAHIELSWGDSLRVDPLAPGLALLAAPYHEVRVDSAGNRVDENGYFTGVAEHGPSGWRLRNAHWSAATAAPEVP